MLSAVVGGHVLGAWSGHVVAVRDAPAGSGTRVRQLALAALMVALTVTTLWSLGQAVVKEPETSAAAMARAAPDAGEGLALPRPARVPGQAP